MANPTHGRSKSDGIMRRVVLTPHTQRGTQVVTVGTRRTPPHTLSCQQVPQHDASNGVSRPACHRASRLCIVAAAVAIGRDADRTPDRKSGDCARYRRANAAEPKRLGPCPTRNE